MIGPRRIIDWLRCAGIAALLVFSVNVTVFAQLRPLDPTDFSALAGDRLRVQVGTGAYFDQHASLAGTRGRLIDVGDVRVSWRAGRVIIGVEGTVQRLFAEETFVEPPAADVHPASADGKRHDAGDYRVQTIVRLSGDAARTVSIVRFGTRLPTTNNREGLERDQTDFFASLGASRPFGPLHFSAEAGVGIYGTRLSHYEQSDVLIYAASAQYRTHVLTPFLSVVGQQDFHDRAPRGNEDLGEVRAGLRFGNARWISASVLGGYHDSSPKYGFTLSVGATFP